MYMTVYYTPPPTVTLTSTRGECTGDACPQDWAGCGLGVANANGTYNVDITFSESVTGFASGDITVTNGSVSNLTGAGASYTATITSSCTDCLVDVSVGANVVTEGNAAAGPLSLPWGESYINLCDAWCSSMDLPAGYQLVLQSNDTTEVDFMENVGQFLPVRIKKIIGSERVADFTVAISGGDAACQVVTVGKEDQKAVVHDMENILNPTGGSFALFVPKIESHTQLRVCSGKTTLGCTSSDSWSFLANAAGTITATNNGFDTTGITVAVADGYWKVSGLTGTGAEGEEGEGGAGGESVPFFPLWALPLVLIGGVWVLKKEGLLWR